MIQNPIVIKSTSGGTLSFLLETPVYRLSSSKNVIYLYAPYSIFNTYGKNVLNGNVMENGLIQLTRLASGIYFLRLENAPLKKYIKN
jgi:hypothetical protein